MVLLGGNASELYHGSLLGNRIPPLLSREKIFALEKAGKKSKVIHDHLLRSGFQRKNERREFSDAAVPVYYREDLGAARFVFPQTRARQPASLSGLAATPEKGLELLLENPHSVEVKYLGQSYDVRVPQIGRFVLANGLRARVSKKASPGEIYRAATHLVYVLDLLVEHEDFAEEALNDLSEIKPLALVREWRDNLKENSPGSILWESAQKLYLDLYPNVKAVKLVSWNWKFQKKLSKTIVDAKTPE